MKSSRVSSVERYRNPMYSGWEKIGAESVGMIPTPMGMQPTTYIRNSRAEMPHGNVGSLDVASVHDGEILAIYLSWEGISPEGGDFPDAAAIAFPVQGNPVLFMMGSKDAPLHILHWKADKGVKSMMAAGIGLSDPGPTLKISSQAEVSGKRWKVVMTRVLGKGAGIAPVLPGQDTKAGFAVWMGANDERAGLKAVSMGWLPLSIEA